MATQPQPTTTSDLSVCPAALTMPGAIRPAFLAAEQQFRRLEMRCDRYASLVAEPARLRGVAAQDALPHTSVAFGSFSNAMVLTTANPPDLGLAKFIVERAARSQRAEPDVAGARLLLAARHRRERAAKRLPEAAAARLAFHRSEHLARESASVEEAFYGMPVISLSELAHKLRVMAERERDWEGCVEDLILPDVQALAGREA